LRCSIIWPGRSAQLKLLSGKTGDSIMLFEETAPVGTETTFHLRRDSDEVAYVLSGEISFKSARKSRSAGRAPAPSYRAPRLGIIGPLPF